MILEISQRQATQQDIALTLANPLEDFLSQVRRLCIVDDKYLTLANTLEDFRSQVSRRCIVDDKYPDAWPLCRTSLLSCPTRWRDFLSQVRRWCIVDDKYANAWPLSRTSLLLWPTRWRTSSHRLGDGVQLMINIPATDQLAGHCSYPGQPTGGLPLTG